jgi:hypothetical protein
MTLEDIEKSLPNGLHDAKVHRLEVDYARRTLQAELTVWIGNMDEPPERRERYRRARIDITGLLFLVMEPPDSRYPFLSSAQLTVDGCDKRQNLDTALLKSLPQKSFFRSLWVGEWNAFIHIAATDARISWIEGDSSS